MANFIEIYNVVVPGLKFASPESPVNTGVYKYIVFVTLRYDAFKIFLF